VFVDGQDVSALPDAEMAALRRRRIGYVLQSFNLMPFLTAADNVAMPLVLDGVRRREIKMRVAEALDLVQMSHRATHDPAHLSGGEQQRIAIARALAIRPRIILADEPTGNLDRTSGRAVMDLIQDVNERTGVTVLLVTHDPVFAAFAQRILELVDGGLKHDVELTRRAAADGSIG
jgi:ABC-type lipoprotein export system ATPase subunit